MTAVEDRPLRADAARNVERLLRAAREVYGDIGPDAPVEAVARRAGVGERTLYRRFPTKADLVRAALDQSIAEDLTPVIESARAATDPLDGLTQLIEAAISLGAREHNLLTAARRAGSLTSDISVSLNTALGELAREGQRLGTIRPDLVTDDLPRLVAMLFSVLSTMDADSGGWRRYVALIVDAISVGERQSLPPAAALRYRRPEYLAAVTDLVRGPVLLVPHRAAHRRGEWDVLHGEQSLRRATHPIDRVDYPCRRRDAAGVGGIEQRMRNVGVDFHPGSPSTTTRCTRCGPREGIPSPAPRHR